MTIDPDIFRSVLSRFATGVTVISTRARDGVDHGMTVSAFCSLSLAPPMVLACVDLTATMYPVLMEVEHFGISMLAQEQEPLSRHFADKAAVRWAGVPQVVGETGVPLVHGAIAHLECRILERHRAGDHTIFVGHVEHGAAHEGRPLVYYRGGYAEIQR